MDQPPFSIENQLCKSLELVNQGGTNAIRRSGLPNQEGQPPTHPKDYLPGEPSIPLSGPTIGVHLEEELATRDLDQLARHLWLVATQDSSHISSLTHQLARGREIVITEKPGLHLVWHYNRVFIKPLPKYILSHTFWAFYLISPDSPIPDPLRSDLREAALGFLRSYVYLIRRRSDFDLAMHEDHRLLPRKTKYRDFARLTKSLDTIDDTMVSPRYSYGELRLSRLNFWIKIFLFRIAYHTSEGQYGPRFARFFTPLAFLFAVFSVQLSAMQVVLAALPVMGDSGVSWKDFAKLSRGFSIFTLFVVAITLLFLLVAFLSLASREAIYALKDLYHKRRLRWRALRREKR